MATNKTNYLKMDVWEPTDYVQRTEFNGNFVKIDADAKKKADEIAGLNIKQGYVTSQLADKADQSELTSVKSQIGNLVVNSTTTNGNTELIDGRVTKDGVVYKTIGNALRTIQTVSKIGKNVLNLEMIRTGGYYDNLYGWNISATNTANITDYYVPVKEGDTFHVSNDSADAPVRRVYFLNASLSFVSVQENATKIVVPAGVSFMHFQIDPVTYPRLQVQYGVPTSYEKFKYVVPKENIDYDFTELESRISQALKRSDNLFNVNKITDNYFVNTAGKLSVNSTSDKFAASHFIDVTGMTSIYISSMTSCAFYNKQRAFTSSIGSVTTTTTTNIVTLPADTSFIRFSIKGDPSKTMVSAVQKPFEEYYIYGDKLKPLADAKPFKRIAEIMYKIADGGTYGIKILGDSITAGLGGSGYAMDGGSIPGADASIKVNTNGYCWANLLRDYLKIKFPNTVVKNWGVSGWASHNIANNIASLVEPTDNIVICMIGTNDRTLRNASQYKANLETIYNYVTGQGKEIIFMANIPASVQNETAQYVNEGKTMYMHMEDVDHAVMSTATKLKCEYISVYKLLIEYCQNRGITIDSLLADGLHPNNSGYDAMFYLITNALGFATKRPGATW